MIMKGLKLFFLSLFALCTFSSLGQTAVGTWSSHLSTSSVYTICNANDRIYAAAAGEIFYYDINNYSVSRLNKTNGLNDVGISTIAYDPVTHCLVIAYNNANIDVVKDDKVVNIGDIKRNDIGGSKKINSIRFHNHCAYLACGFGIVVVDLNRYEIKETYYLGKDGTYRNINDVVFTSSLIVAATNEGILSVPLSSSHPNIVDYWTEDSSSLIASLQVKKLDVAPDGKLLALVNDDEDSLATIYREMDSMTFAPWQNGTISNMKVTHNKILTIYYDTLLIHNAGYEREYAFGHLDWMAMYINDADISDDGRLWMGHKWASMAVFELNDPLATLNVVRLHGPGSDNVFRLTSWNDELVVAPGGHRTTYEGTYLPADAYTFDGKKWKALNDPDGLLKNLMDVTHVAVNPKRPQQKMAAVWRYGILEINDNTVTTLYNETNSNGALIPFSDNDYSALLTGGVAFDRYGNLWVTNSLRPEGLSVRYSDGSWKSFYTQNMVAGSDLDNIIYDSIYGLKLFWGRANKIFVHDGDSLMAYIDPNNGAKMETASIQTVCQDHNGNIWIGTNKGIKVIYDLQKIFQNGGHGEKSPVTCNNILFNENGINEYLLAYESVLSIAVDGANRKWVGTSSGGLYLLSSNGLSQLEHFTAANSPLFSDKVMTLSIMPWIGELFIGTDKGLQSYRTTATYAYATPSEDIYAFPNPVRPDYDGVIAIKGFSRNALVHITDAAGHVVYSTTSNGGQAIWNGCTNSGKRVASGVYYVFASSESGEMRSVTKILIIK